MIEALKRRIRKILHYKSDGVIDQYLPTMITLVFLLMITLFFIHVIGDVNLTNQFHQTARKYILRMESEGGLTDSTKTACENEIKNIAAVIDDTVQVTGSSTSTTSYGDVVTITISADVYSTGWSSAGTSFGQINTDQIRHITVTKQSTAKY